MDLPTVLVNQFAKVTNDKKDDLKVETLYGRAKIVDGKQYVQMDGSDLLTPCTSSVTLKNDDRVIVRVGNHEAVVTGNLTAPSVSEGDVTAITEKKLETVTQSLDAYDQKLKQMNELAANTLGFYYTEEKDENGATISYRHDKPSLADSTIIYKTGIEGFFLSVDGGVTWKAGFDSNGDAVLNILYAIGIQSKWINTRGFTATDNSGKETFKIDEATGAVYIDPNVFMLGDKEFADMINQAVENNTGVVMILSNESQTVSTDSNGNILGSFNCETVVSVMSGSVDVTASCTISPTTVFGISNYTWDEADHKLTVTGISQDNCYVEFTGLYNDITVKRRFTIVKQRQGANGTNGKGIASITVYYATNNSTSAPTSGWSTSFTAPTETAKYLWTYQVTTFTDGSTETTTPHVIGTYGRDGGQLSAAEIWELLLSMHKDFIYKGSDGNIYIKATYIDTGNLCGWTADRINKTLTAENGTEGKIILDASTGKIYTEDWTSAYSGTRKINRDGTSLKGMNIVTVRVDAFSMLTDSITCYDTSEFEGTATFKVAPKLKNLTHVTSGGYVSFLTDGATLAYKASSSKRYKNHVREMTKDDIQKLYDLKPVWFTYKDGYLYEEDPKLGKPIPGFYAEVMSEYFPDACVYDSEGRPEDWDPKELVPAMLLMLQEQKKTIDKLEERLSALENK